MDYAQSRLQARFGEFTPESLWRKLEEAPKTAVALEIARSCGLKRWVGEIPPDAESHEIEVALRARWRECVNEIASWMPCSWQSALLWTRELAVLPALDYLARGGAPLQWMHGDPVLQAYARADSPAREAMLREALHPFMGLPLETRHQTVSQAMPGPSQIRQAWLMEWRRRWPRWSDTAPLDDLARLLDAAMRQPVVASRPELLPKLRSLFRRSVLHPVVAFIYIAFAALDIQRLRAALMRHFLAHEGMGPS